MKAYFCNRMFVLQINALMTGCFRPKHATAALIVYCRCISSPVVDALKIAVITGTTRTSGPPRPIIGPRVANFVQNSLERRGNTVTIVDPREIDLPLLEKTHFAYATSQVPPVLQELHEIFTAADAYVTVTPEYNHAPSPALVNVLNHFGSSTFSWKPSAIVSYSAGQWGGTRAAHSLRPILSELGCIPVSAMVHIPYAGNVFDEKGRVQGGEEEVKRWEKYVDRSLSQLEWWANAAKDYRKVQDPNEASPAFRSDPSQRNAP